MLLRLFKIEKLKWTKTTFIWVVALISFLLVVAVSFVLKPMFEFFTAEGMKNTTGNVPGLSIKPDGSFLRSFPYVWYYYPMVFSLGIFKIFAGLLMIYTVCSEFANRTARQHVIDGMSRDEFVISKIVTAFSITVFFTLSVLLIAVILGLTGGVSGSVFGQYWKFPFLYFYELFCYLIFVLMLSVLLRHSLITVVVLLVYSLFIEPIIGTRLPDNLSAWLPLHAISYIIPLFGFDSWSFSIPLQVKTITLLRPLLYVALYLGISFARFRKMNL